MMEAVETVCVRENDRLRGRCARAHLPCCDEGEGDGVPPVAPTDFTVVLGAVLAGRTEREMREGMEDYHELPPEASF